MPHCVCIHLGPEELPDTLHEWTLFIAKLQELVPEDDPDEIVLTAIDDSQAHQFSAGDPVQGLILRFYVDVEGAENVEDLDLELYDCQGAVREAQAVRHHLEEAQKAAPCETTTLALATQEEQIRVLEERLNDLWTQVKAGYALVNEARQDWELKVKALIEEIDQMILDEMMAKVPK